MRKLLSLSVLIFTCIITLNAQSTVFSSNEKHTGNVPIETVNSVIPVYNIGETAILSPSVQGSNSYQWLKNNIIITGATSKILVINNITFSDEGEYICIISNESGTIYSEPLLLALNDFSYSCTVGTINDIEGNLYNRVQINTQCWMKDNLKATKYRDGSIIPHVADNTSWSALLSGARAYYNGDSTTYNPDYGALYNWYAVNDPRNICPTGWHVPQDAEWTVLTDFLGGESNAGGKMKEAGSVHWTSPNTGADNSSGFTGLPGGRRLSGGTYSDIGNYGFWWSSTQYSISNALGRNLDYNNILVGNVALGNAMTRGHSVRCIKTDCTLGSISLQKTDPVANNGTINLNITGGSSPFTFLWSNNATTQNLSNLGPGNYSVTVTDANACNAISSIILLQQVSILSNPVSQVICENTNAMFSVGTENINPLYQWQIYETGSWNNIINSGVYSGATDDTLKMTSVPISFTGNQFRCIVTDGTDSDTTSVATITVIATGVTVTDTINHYIHDGRDCQNYAIVKVGSQWWMADNLKTRKFRNGDLIADGTGTGNISGLVNPKLWFVYNDSPSNEAEYGLMYTWHTVSDTRHICASGWHEASNNEWQTLFNSLGGDSIAGAKLKETGTEHWNVLNTNATNESGFTALPAGSRGNNGTFSNLGASGRFWSRTEASSILAWRYELTSANISVTKASGNKSNGFSVRCLLSKCSDVLVSNTITLCEGQVYNIGNHSYTINGTYHDTLLTNLGCDSIVTTYLTFNPVPLVYIGNDTTISADSSLILHAGNIGCTYLWNNSSTSENITVSSPGMYYVAVTSPENCTAYDSIYISNPSFPLTSNFFPHEGIIRIMSSDTVPSQQLNYLPSGPAQYWDFTALVQHRTDTTKILSPENTPFAVDFPESNAASNFHDQNNNDVWGYYIYNPTELLWSGTAYDLSNTGVYGMIHMENMLTCAHFPSYYLDEFIDPYSINQKLPYSVPIYGIDSLYMHNVDTIFRSYDAWGTMVLPFGTFSVIREKTLEHKHESTSVRQFGVWSSEFTTHDTTLTYIWMTENIPMPLVEMKVNPQTGAILKVDFLNGFVANTDFIASDTTVNTGESIVFSDISSAPATAWLWDFGDGNTSTIQNPVHSYSTPGIYTVSLTITYNGTQISKIKTAYIVVTDCVFNISIGNDTAICNNTPLLVTIYGGTAPYIYNWSSGCTSSDCYVNTTATYSITVTDINGCVASDTVDITVWSAPEVIISGPTEVCQGNNIMLNSSVTGGISPFSYSWSPGYSIMSTYSVNPQQTTTFQVVVRDAHQCKDTASYIVNVIPKPVTSVITGATAAAQYETKSYTVDNTFNNIYNWTVTGGNILSGQSTNYITVNWSVQGVGTVCVTETNLQGCVGTTVCTQVEVDFSCSGFAVNLQGVDPTCSNSCNGYIPTAVSGGTAPFTYLWNDSQHQTGSTAVNLCAGTYTITVHDQFQCMATATVSLIAPMEIQINVNPINAHCGINDGGAISSVTGGHPPFTYYWTDGSTTSSVDSLSSGMYMLTVTDNTGCSNFTLVTINDQDGPVINVDSISHLTCFHSHDGAIDISVTGGTAPYTYSWSNGMSTQDISNLEAGPYEIEVSNSNGCIASMLISVQQPANLHINVSTIESNCGTADGSATLAVTGGTLPYEFNWSTGDSIQNLTNMLAGMYYVTVTDSHGCESSNTMVSISNNGGPQVTIDSVLSASCNGTNGGIYVSVSDGAAPYEFNWSNSTNNEDLTGIGMGNYSVTVTDVNGCIGTGMATVDLIMQNTPQICMVLVDSSITKNLIVWEKEVTTGIDHYNIYREGSWAGVYFLVGSKNYGDLSTFVDTSSHPTNRSYRYYITSVDQCNHESQPSIPHKTMFLSINSGIGGAWNLQWSDYEGFNFPGYYIWRNNQSNGWILLDSIAVGYNFYTDVPPGQVQLKYLVTVRAPYFCNPTLGKEMTGPFSQSLSNIEDNGIILTETSLYSNLSVEIYPNPAKNRVYIKSEKDLMLRVYNLIGEIIYQGDIVKANSVILNQNGVYVFEFTDGKKFIYKKVVVQ